MHTQRQIDSGPDQRLLISNDPISEDPSQPEHEDATFKPKIFAEFTSYFLLAQWLGPLSYFFFVAFIQNGRVLARNLHIFGGWRENLRILLWVAKLYCFIVTFTLGVNSQVDKDGENTYESRSQFWLVIYTDIALAVLHGGYYSSFTESEIKKFKSEACNPEDNIVSQIVQLIRTEKTRAFERRVIVSRYPEIDVNNFFFVYPEKYANIIPEQLQPRPVQETAGFLKRILISNGLIVDGDKYAEYLTDKGGYRQLSKNVLVIQIISRILVFIRVVLPVAQNVDRMLENNESSNENGRNLILYVVQQTFYCYFISKFAEIYDVLFLGLLLYYRRLKLLRVLKQLIDVRPQKSQTELLKIVPTVPQNIENWLTLRKIFSGMNQQAFVVIDINTSFTLLYTILFIGFYALYALNLIKDFLQPVADFMTQNNIFQAAIFFTVVIVVIVLLVHLALGIMINLLFTTERKEWTLQSEIMRSIRISHNVYHDWKTKKSVDELLDGDEYMERVENVQNVMGSFFKTHFEDYIKKLRDAVSLVLDGLNYEEAINPHTLLGITTTPRLAISVVTLVSAVGLSTINDFINQATGKK